MIDITQGKLILKIISVMFIITLFASTFIIHKWNVETNETLKTYYK